MLREREMDQDHYRVLEVEPSASLEEIRQHYRFLMLAFHPDRFSGGTRQCELAEAKARQINEAFRVLSNPGERALYDFSRKRRSCYKGEGYDASTLQMVDQLEHKVDFLQSRLQKNERALAELQAQKRKLCDENAALLQQYADLSKVWQQEKSLLEYEKIDVVEKWLETLQKPTGISHEPSRVALVDDEVNVLRSIQRTLGDEPFLLTTFKEPLAALESIKSQSFSVVVSDQRMPGMSGVELLSAVGRLCPGTLRIMISGYADLSVLVAAVNQGRIHHFISKPWDDLELKLVLNYAVSEQRLREKERRSLALSLGQNGDLRALVTHLEDRSQRRPAHTAGLTKNLNIWV